MAVRLSLNDLMDYTDWDRQKWHDWLGRHGGQVLKISAGPNGDGRFTTVGDLMRHMFSAEKRYVARLSGQPLSDPTSVPNDDVEALFRFGRQSRKNLKEFVESFPAEQWDVLQDHQVLKDSGVRGRGRPPRPIGAGAAKAPRQLGRSSQSAV
jgi:hypothetical protein